jgi:hypothetical protein
LWNPKLKKEIAERVLRLVAHSTKATLLTEVPFFEGDLEFGVAFFEKKRGGLL